MPASLPDNPFWTIFSLAFLVALSGAMAPGPLLTYTITKSAGNRKRGYLMGVWIIAGHALVEMGIVAFLLLGFSHVLRDTLVVRGIAVAGGGILILFGFSIIRDVRRGTIATTMPEIDSPAPVPSASAKGFRGLENPVIGGVLVSMSNPYWWVWWATIGSAFMLQFDITLQNWPRLLAFFLGHEAGDLAWYLIVSVLVFYGLQRFNRRVYYGILLLCGAFMIAFGVYLGIAPFCRT